MTSRGLVGELNSVPFNASRRGTLLQRIGRVVDTCSPFGDCFPAANGQALAAYYLGVLTLVPLFGVFAAGPALACGLTGARRSRGLPGREGGAHAWAGIVLGALAGLANLVWAVTWAAAELAIA